MKLEQLAAFVMNKIKSAYRSRKHKNKIQVKIKMNGLALFYFYDSLNDFLPSAKRNTWISFNFTGAPAIKDAIEAIGIPHPEVNVILINQEPADFTTPLHSQDQVQVYPASNRIWPEHYTLQPKNPVLNRFILDIHLGKLAKALRLLGFDCCYENNYSDKIIARLAEDENRIVLTRDVGLLKHKSIQRGYWLRSQHLSEQLTEVIRYFNLAGKFKPFTRCLECNGAIRQVSKADVLPLLPPKTKQYFHEFYQCPICQRVYWKGSHYERMQAFLADLDKQWK